MVVRWLLVIAGWVLLEARTLAAANGGLVLPSGAASQQAAEGARGKLESSCGGEGDCLVQSSHCDPTTKKCQCNDATPVNIGHEQCLGGSRFNESCTQSEQCLYYNKGTTCKQESSLCQCSTNHKYSSHPNGTHYCKIVTVASDNKPHPTEPTKVDVTMLAVLISLAVMFIIMCIVLRMFSKAQFRDQRTIFNSPRLMKKSLSKARAERRSSHVSVGSRAGSRAGSRHASIQSGLNLAGGSPRHSPKGSRESIAIPNSNSLKRLSAPIAEDDDGSPKAPHKGDDSPHVAIKLENDNIASV